MTTGETISGAVHRGDGLNRRSFVWMVSSALAATWITDLRWSSAGEIPAAPDGPALMPGYLHGSRELVMDEVSRSVLYRTGTPFYDGVRAGISADEPLEFVPADTLDAVPRLEGTSAVVEVLGLLPPDQVRLDHAIEAIDLVVAFKTREQPNPPSFLAWTYDRRPIEQLAGPTRFNVPLGDDVVVRLAIRLDRDRPAWDPDPRDDTDDARRTGDDRRPEVFLTEIPVHDSWQSPRLRAGLYVLPMSRPAQRAIPGPANREWLTPLDLQFLAVLVRPQP